MIYEVRTLADGTTERVPVLPQRFIVNETKWLLHPDDMEVLMQAQDRSPKPPRHAYRLTECGYESARQQLLKERLRKKWGTP